MFICHLYILFVEVPHYDFAHFLIGLFACLLLSCGSSLYILDTGPFLGYMIFKYFPQSYHPLNRMFHRAKVLNFDEDMLITFAFNG